MSPRPKITLAILKTLAGEMNEVMGLEPEIEEYDDKDELEARIIDETKDENGECQIYESDYADGKTTDKEGEPKFSKKSWAVLAALGIEPVQEGDPGKPLPAEKETPKETPKKKAPPKKKSAPAKKEKPDKKAPAKPPADKKPKYTRFDSFAAAVKTGVKNIEKLTEKSNDLYAKQGGKDNIKEAKTVANMAIKVLVAMNMASVEKGMLQLDN